MMPPNQQTFLEHLIELRSRLVKALIALALGFIISLFFAKKIYYFIQIPMLKTLPEGSNFIATTPFESYITYFKVSFWTGLFGVSPIIFYHFWMFTAPALEKKEKRFIFPFTVMSALLFIGGALFGYFVVFPTGFYYVNLLLEGTAIHLMPKMSDYLNVAITMLLAFGVSFELPLFIFLLGKMGLIDYATIHKNRRYVIVGLFFLAAILTPGPDVLSQCLLALPLWILYELGGLSLFLLKRKQTKTL